MTSYWIVVASKEHVMRGIAEGIIQACHGKKGPLQQMRPGDYVVYYSPTERFREAEPCQKFTALGIVQPGDPYPFRMSDDFVPWRRAVQFVAAHEASIRPLLSQLSFTKGASWGITFRRGYFKISHEDFLVIAHAMGYRPDVAS